MTDNVTIAPIETDEDIDAVRDLVREFFAYAASLDSNAASAHPFLALEKELAGLPGKYAPPDGMFLLARLNGVPVGCGAYYTRSAGVAEIRRMYVRPEARGLSLGRRILSGLVETARDRGVARMILGTFYKLEAAQALYARAGFEICPAFEEVPPGYEDKVIFMDMAL